LRKAGESINQESERENREASSRGPKGEGLDGVYGKSQEFPRRETGRRSPGNGDKKTLLAWR